MAYASTVDLEEAYRSGQTACLLAAGHIGGFMATILREPGPIYSAKYDKVPLEKVAAADRSFPKQWISANGYDVTDDFVRYAMPLVGEDMVTLPMVGGRQRLTRFEPIHAPQKLPSYVPQADRKK
jgi:6-phosphofructokinase 1